MEISECNEDRRPMKARDIDHYIACTPIIAPRGGEIVVESIETFDCPVLPASASDLVELRNALGRVLEQYSNMGSAERERLDAVRADLNVLFNEATTGKLSDEEFEREIGEYVLSGKVPKRFDTQGN